MGKNTGISWAHHTFSTHWGCEKVSPACDKCYAETLSKRYDYDIWGKDAPRRFFGDKHWNELLHWDRDAKSKGRVDRVFVDSMSDLFEDRRDLDPVRERFFSLVGTTTNLIFLLLTKRSNKIMEFVPAAWKTEFPKNVWMGVTAENQRRFDERMPDLIQVPALHWISYEPALEKLDVSVYGSHVDWLIIGGESGVDARPMDLEWARHSIAQCRQYNIVPFVKQLGGYPNARKNMDEWPDDLKVQEFPT